MLYLPPRSQNRHGWKGLELRSLSAALTLPPRDRCVVWKCEDRRPGSGDLDKVINLFEPHFFHLRGKKKKKEIELDDL